jgi:hypothetical protein
VERPEHLVNNVVLSWVRDSSALVVTKRLTAHPKHLGGPANYGWYRSAALRVRLMWT